MDWNAEQYHKVSDPQFEWGLSVLARVVEVPLRGNETVLDAGCGTGRLTRELAALFPQGRIVASDRSANMLHNFAKSLRPNGNGQPRRPLGERVQLVLADFQSLPFRETFDIIFSNAAFHWAPDHESLFSSIFRALKRKGRLVAQCGGGPNLAAVREREQILMRDRLFAPFFRKWSPPWNYADVPTTLVRLKDVGFHDSEVWLEPSPIQMPDAASFRALAETVLERTQVQLISDPELRELYLDRFVDLAAGEYVFDYVRLNINAQKG